MKYKLSDAISFNPRESLKKGTMAKKIAMDKLQPFCRDIPGYELAEFSGGTKFRNGDTIMARITPCLENGKTAQVNLLDENEVGFGSTEFIVFRAKAGITDPDYIYYLVCSPIIRDVAIKTMVGSSGRQRVQTDVLQNLEYDFPNLAEQKKIGAILRNIDDKISLNKKTNDNLEQQAKSLVDAYLYNLEEYSILKLSDVADCQNGRAFYKDGYDLNGAMVVDLGNVNLSGNFIRTSADKFITKERYSHPKLEKYRLYKDDLVMVMTDRKSTMELLGKTGKIYSAGYYLLNQRMYRIRAKHDMNINYLYAYLNSTVVSDYLKSQALGSVQKYVNTGSINDIQIKVPMPEKMEELSAMLDPIYAYMENNIIENENLVQLRNTLLPKLMSGEIDVEGIEL